MKGENIRGIFFTLVKPMSFKQRRDVYFNTDSSTLENGTYIQPVSVRQLAVWGGGRHTRVLPYLYPLTLSSGATSVSGSATL